MEKIKGILNIIWTTAWMIILPLIILNLIFYGIGSFVAWNFNPLHWWIFTSSFGRILIAIIELSFIGSIPEFWEIIDDF